MTSNIKIGTRLRKNRISELHSVAYHVQACIITARLCSVLTLQTGEVRGACIHEAHFSLIVNTKKICCMHTIYVI